MDRDALIELHRHLVPLTLKRMLPKVPDNLDADDLESEGVIGLIRAADCFDPARGVKFQSYAISKIRFAILEYLRREDWVPRSERDRQKAGEPALIYEVLSLEALIRDTPEESDPLMLMERLADPAEAVGSEVPARLEASVVAGLVDCLPRRLRKIVRQVYWDDVTGKEIAGQMDLSERRVHQLHHQALHLMRAQLKRWRPESYARG